MPNTPQGRLRAAGRTPGVLVAVGVLIWVCVLILPHAASSSAPPANALGASTVLLTADAPTNTADAVATESPAAAPVELPVEAAPDTPAVAGLDPVERWAREGIVLQILGQEWDATSLSDVDRALSLLPPAVRSQLGNHALGPLTILVNREGRSLDGTQPYGGAANYFSTNENDNELVLYPGQAVLTVLHELGHAYNLRDIPAGSYALVLQDGEMSSFMAATGWQVLTPPAQLAHVRDQTEVAYAYSGESVWQNLSHNDPLEDYANSFALYYGDPASLQSLSPVRYAWFAANSPQ